MKRVPMWEIFEVVLRCEREFANPFLEVELTARFTSGRFDYEADGFHDGDGTWKLRFSPPATGEWRFESRSNIDVLDGVTGRFLCTDAISRGALSIDDRYPNWFSASDGKPLWVVNDGWYPHPVYGDLLPHESLEFGNPSEEEMRLHIRILAEHRVNLLIETDQLYARQSHLTDGSFNWPWRVVDAATNRIDADRFNIAYYQRIERTLAYAASLGVYYGYELMFDNSTYRTTEWANNPLNRKNGGWIDAGEQEVGWAKIYDPTNEEHLGYLTRYLRYTIARLSAYRNVVWELGTESGNLAVHRPGVITVETMARWFTLWTDYLERKDIYRRLTTVGDTGELEALLDHRANRITLTQEHTSMASAITYAEAINAFGERFWPRRRPTLIGEQDRRNCGCYDSERVGYWTAFVSGFFMGRVDRHFAVAERAVLRESTLFCHGAVPPIYADLKRMSDFIVGNGVRYWRMVPNDALLRDVEGAVYCLAEQSEEYLLYFVDGGKVTLELPVGTSVWFDPRTGKTMESERHGAGSVTFMTPAANEWVLYFRKKVSVTAESPP